jgi:hypothetical protein
MDLCFLGDKPSGQSYNNLPLLLKALPMGSQFYQHFARSILVRKFSTQLHCTYILRFVLFWRKIIGANVALKMLVKLAKLE